MDLGKVEATLTKLTDGDQAVKHVLAALKDEPRILFSDMLHKMGAYTQDGRLSQQYAMGMLFGIALCAVADKHPDELEELN